MNLKRLLAAALAVAALASPPASARDYPTGRVTMVAPFAAGGPTDVVARLVAKVIETQLGKPVLAENATGAGGALASARLARSAEPGQ